MTQRLYDCHNGPAAKETVTVQDGWFYRSLPTCNGGRITPRMPRMVEIPNPMSRDCRYDKSSTDARCMQCVHAPQSQNHHAN